MSPDKGGKSYGVFSLWHSFWIAAWAEDDLTISVNMSSLGTLHMAVKMPYTGAGERLHDYISRANTCMIKFYELFFQEKGPCRCSILWSLFRGSGICSLLHLTWHLVNLFIHCFPFGKILRWFETNITGVRILFRVESISIFFFIAHLLF